MKKFLVTISSFTFFFIMFLINPIFSEAQTSSKFLGDLGKESLSYENYQKYIDSGLLESELPYDTWVEINSEDRTNHLNSQAPNQSISTLSTTASLVRGDILISNGTDVIGLIGHAGIVVGNNEILHIAGPGSTPKVISYDTWSKNYAKKRGGIVNTEVYRISNWTHRNNAADWARDKYANSGAGYSLMSTLDTFKYTYCSKIVWQAYYYGSTTALVNFPASDLATPYGLPKYFKSSAGLSFQFSF